MSSASGCRNLRRNVNGSAPHNNHLHEHQAVTNLQSIATKPVGEVPLVEMSVGNVKIDTNTTQATMLTATANTIQAETVVSTVLVIARDKASAYSAYSGLNDHGIPYYVQIVTPSGASLPSLNDSATTGNFGLIVVMSEVSFLNNSTGNYQSALTDAQWTSLFNYQVSFGVRMVRLDVAPSAATGTQSLGGCCSAEEQLISISNTTHFPTAGIKVGAGVSTLGLYHYPATITDSSIATEFAQFAAATTEGFSTISTAGVINRIGGREQMVFFIGFSTDWSLTSNFLQHAWIQWGTRGLYAGYRRAMLTPQIDDMFLETPMFDNPNLNIRVGPKDLTGTVAWMPTLRAKLNFGSDWFLEVGHNGNGNIEAVDNVDDTGELCTPGPVEYSDQIDTALEFMKPLDTGTDLYPKTPTTYPSYKKTCTNADDLLTWWQTTTNLNAFAHISHTFTHEDVDNATYTDAYKEITWNQGWLASVGIDKATKFTASGIIPPAITGLHNGDALRAWAETGIKHVVGDNTRPVLLNTVNEHWPLISTVAANGYAGIQITPRWASNIYYNCNLPACTVAEWKNTSAGVGDFSDLMTIEKNTNVRHLLGLHHDPYMFHQANLWWDEAPAISVNGISGHYSLLMVWVETIVAEFTRLVNWPITSQTHGDLAGNFMSRMARDACKPNLSWVMDPSQKIITGITVTATGNTGIINKCTEALPVTFPGAVKNTQGYRQEQLGSDPLTLWVNLTGTPVTFTLSTPVSVF
ncbi:hypothetical protein LSUE1_G001269 [Lachnellula suecica]|uniref:Extracellular serine-rich protein n=1 Tax=Lachnellula suecica TaxID=602035 RepID=A0A8T9CHM3_9HELO|nr:hypothetical protein LSUE1_G001269 [Lachnellula suecica]